MPATAPRGRAADGPPFGVERLSDFVVRHSHDGTPAPEMIRRLHHAISDHQHGTLIDDAGLVANLAKAHHWLARKRSRSLTLGQAMLAC